VRATHPHADCRVFSVLRKSCRHPARGTERDFFSLHSCSWVNVIALTPAREIVLVNQFRFGVERCSLEIPGGMIDAGEDALAAGLRELEEETGFVGQRGRLIGQVWPNPAIMDNVCFFVLVEDAVPTSDMKWDQDEEIEVTLAPVDQVMEWARNGRIRHSLVLNALFHFQPIWAELGDEFNRTPQAQPLDPLPDGLH
jgi:8-oxo-dGTP pyrophosphatase MutT (NUDIX family)